MQKKKKIIHGADCIVCVKKKWCCCADLDTKVMLTIEDIENIKSKGFKIEDFVTFEKFFRKKKDEKWWKKSAISTKGKKIKTVAAKKNSKCFFLEEKKGCILGEKKPLICKIYPFWINEKKEVIGEPSEKKVCEVLLANTTLKEQLESVGENEKTIKEYFGKIKKDFCKNKKKHEKILKSNNIV